MDVFKKETTKDLEYLEETLIWMLGEVRFELAIREAESKKK